MSSIFFVKMHYRIHCTLCQNLQAKERRSKKKRNTTRIIVVKPSNPMYNYKNADLGHLILLKKPQM